MRPRLFACGMLIACFVVVAGNAQPPLVSHAESRASAEPIDLVPHRLLPLIHANEVQRELKLTSTQIAELEKFFARLDGPWFRCRILSADKQEAELAKLESEFWNWASTSLKPAQIKRLKQIEVQAVGYRVLLRPDIARQTGFTSKQREKLLELANATIAVQKKLQVAEQKHQPKQELEKLLNEASQAEQSGTVELLNDGQKQQLNQLIGEPFDTTRLKRIYPMAPELASETKWINSQPLTLAGLRGKVVLVHFYAFQCHNCHANFDIYRRWHKQWEDQGVVVIGIQSPETDRERDYEAVCQAAKDRQLEFPIIMDKDMKNWNAWANTMWPTVYVIDKRGYLRHWWQGELNWQGATGDKVIEQVVEAALAEQ